MNDFEINLGLKPYNDSARFIFGLVGGDLSDDLLDFDILNNPYVDLVGAQMTSGDGLLNLDNVHELEICDNSYLESFLSEHTL